MHEFHAASHVGVIMPAVVGTDRSGGEPGPVSTLSAAAPSESPWPPRIFTIGSATLTSPLTH